MYIFRQVPVVFGKSFISKVLCVDFEDVLLFPPPLSLEVLIFLKRYSNSSVLKGGGGCGLPSPLVQQ